MQHNSKIPFHVGLAGHVSWEVLNSDGSQASSGEHKNLILDSGLDLVATNWIASCFAYCCVGTGNATPIISQIGLDSEKARTNNYMTSGDGCGTWYVAEGVIKMKRTFDFPLGALNSAVQGPYAEVGFSPLGTAGNNLFSRSLFKDGGGAPITISVLSTQQLRVTYSLTVDFSSLTSWKDGSFNLSGVGTIPYKVRLPPMRPFHEISSTNRVSTLAAEAVCFFVSALSQNGVTANVGNFYSYAVLEPKCSAGRERLVSNPTLTYADVSPIDSNVLYDIASMPSVSGGTTATKMPYSAGSFYLDTQIVFDPNAANFASNWFMLQSLKPYYNYGSYAYLLLNFLTPITKDNLHTLTLVLRRTWGRI